MMARDVQRYASCISGLGNPVRIITRPERGRLQRPRAVHIPLWFPSVCLPLCLPRRRAVQRSHLLMHRRRL